jgi:hypothetical protein
MRWAGWVLGAAAVASCAVVAMDAYVQGHVPPRFERPQVVTTQIVNRYAQFGKPWIWYTYRDHGTFSLNQDVLRREFALAGRMGIEHF